MDVLSDILTQETNVSRMRAVGAEILRDSPDPDLQVAEIGSRQSPRLEKMEEARTEQWFRDLEDPLVPLDTLASTVPGDLTDAALLDKLASRRIPILRASWLVKVMISSEMPLSLIVVNGEPRWATWGDSIRMYLSTQLDEFVLDPEVSTPPHPSKGQHKENKPMRTATADAAMGESFEKFRYTIKLLQWQCDEGLLPLSTFVKWAVQKFRKANEPQVGHHRTFVVRRLSTHIKNSSDSLADLPTCPSASGLDRSPHIV